MSSENPREQEDLCGQELVPELPSEDLAEEYGSSNWYEAQDGTHHCRREVWDEADTDRCIWHADVEGKSADVLAAGFEGLARLDRAVLRESTLADGISLSGCRIRDADLRGADLQGADLQRADLGGAALGRANLGGAVLRDANLDGAALRGANLGGAVLSDADLGGGDLQLADLDGAALRDADLDGADLLGADLGGAVLRGADLTACKLRQTTFEDATLDESTTFGTPSGYEIEADNAAENDSRFASHVWSRLRALSRPSTDPKPLERAETQYRTVQRLRREHDLKQDPALEVQEKHARRKRALAERRYWDWFQLALYRWPIGYGEQPRNVVGTSVVVILAAMLAYPHAGGFERPTGSTTPVAELSQALVVPEAVTSAVGPWLTSFYFSVVTFTTVGYGDLQPATEMGRLLASVESFLGALLMALLVFVLGRRATW